MKVTKNKPNKKLGKVTSRVEGTKVSTKTKTSQKAANPSGGVKAPSRTRQNSALTLEKSIEAELKNLASLQEDLHSYEVCLEEAEESMEELEDSRMEIVDTRQELENRISNLTFEPDISEWASELEDLSNEFFGLANAVEDWEEDKEMAEGDFWSSKEQIPLLKKQIREKNALIKELERQHKALTNSAKKS